MRVAQERSSRLDRAWWAEALLARIEARCSMLLGQAPALAPCELRIDESQLRGDGLGRLESRPAGERPRRFFAVCRAACRAR